MADFALRVAVQTALFRFGLTFMNVPNSPILPRNKTPRDSTRFRAINPQRCEVFSACYQGFF